MIRYIFSISILLSLFFILSCRHVTPVNEKQQLTVTIVPQKYLTKLIAGNKWEILVMLPTGSNHETYEPAPRDLEKIKSSKLYFQLGALDFELAWLDRIKASNPLMKVINTSDGITMLYGHVHEDETKEDTEVQGVDPHIWLSPACMKIQARNMCSALCDADSSNTAYYKKNLDGFIKIADSVDQIVREKLSKSTGKSLLIFHPALAYFARDYDLEQISIEQNGKEPSPAWLEELTKIALSKKLKVIFISKEFDTRNAEALANEINGKVVVFDPMAENWADNLIHLADLIASN